MFHVCFERLCISRNNLELSSNPLQCSCLENPRDGGAWWLLSMRSHRVGHDWSDLAAATTGKIGMWTRYSLAIYSGHKLQSSNLFLDHSSTLLIEPLGGAQSWRSLNHWWESLALDPRVLITFYGRDKPTSTLFKPLFQLHMVKYNSDSVHSVSHLKKCVLVSLGVITEIP